MAEHSKTNVTEPKKDVAKKWELEFFKVRSQNCKCACILCSMPFSAFFLIVGGIVGGIRACPPAKIFSVKISRQIFCCHTLNQQLNL